MDKIARIRAEIERRMKIYKESNYGISLRYQELEEILSFLDTLSEEPDKSLEEEVKSYFQGYWPGTETVEQCNTDLHFTPPAIIRLARHFADWQKEQDEAEKNLKYFYGLDEGAKIMKEQMMKDAMKGKVNQDGFLELSNGEVIDICPTLKRCALGLHIGDKVRIVVLKAEEE